MASYRNEYEVTVEPTGQWTVRHIVGERSTEVANGSEKGPDCMGRAETAACAFIEGRLKELEEAHEYRKRCKVFSVPAAIAYLHGKRIRS